MATSPATLPQQKETDHLDHKALYRDHINGRWVTFLELLGMEATYTRCQGIELHTADGRRILDFLSGYCVYNTGHNHPEILTALHQEMDRLGPTMLQSHIPDLAAELAWRLSELAGGRLKKVFFTSSGSEGVETAIKFSRAHTGRDGLLYAQGSFHGLTCGALSLMDNAFWRSGFGPLLPGTACVPFGDLNSLETAVASGKFAAFIVEPLQSEAGIQVAPEGYLKAAQDICHRHGTLFVLDEVQTGLHRTGPFLAAHHDGLDPDMVILAKALSGGLIPCGAVLMSDAVHGSVYSALSRALIHASTFSENQLAMRAALATLRVLEAESLGERATVLGCRLRQKMTDAIGHFEMVDQVRGQGLLNGIVFREPRSLRLRMPYKAFAAIHSGVFGQLVVSRLFRQENILTQVCGNDHMVLKMAPPLVAGEQQIDDFVASVRRVLQDIHQGASFWAEGIGLARRSLKI